MLLGGLVYEVTDAVHPRLLCKVSNTKAHFYSANVFTYLKPGSSSTAVIAHGIQDGHENQVGQIPLPDLNVNAPFGPTWWSPDGTFVAVTIPPSQPGVSGDSSRVWLHTPSYTGDLYSYTYPLTDCLCRFGLPRPTESMSADRQFMIAGWPLGKGPQGLAVYRLSDRSQVKVFDAAVQVALWDRAGHRLFLSSGGGSWSWTPEGGLASLAGANAWSYLAGLSPDASQIAYTAYLDPANSKDLRVYVYDVKADKTRMLVDNSRSQVVFVKTGWVWYLDEAQCDPNAQGCGPWGTAPSGKVIAMNLATGVEQQVDFQYNEATTDLVPGEFWPSS